MTDKVQFELVSPERLLLSEAVEMVVVPGAEGDFGVLKDHAPMISAVRPGVIEVHDEGTVKDRIFVAGGFAEVTGERCTVLAEEAVRVSEIDRGAAEAELRRLQGELAAATGEAERDALATRVEAAEAKVAVLTQ
jgi:F-type H+-transporting ATPase subunit epsilon